MGACCVLAARLVRIRSDPYHCPDIPVAGAFPRNPEQTITLPHPSAMMRAGAVSVRRLAPAPCPTPALRRCSGGTRRITVQISAGAWYRVSCAVGGVATLTDGSVRAYP